MNIRTKIELNITDKMWVKRLLRGPILPLLYSLLLSDIFNHVRCLPETVKVSSNLSMVVGQHTNHGEPVGSSHIKRSIDDCQRQGSVSSLASLGFLLNDSTDLKLNLSDPIDRNLSRILDRDGPDMRPSRDYKDFKDITMDISKRAWNLLHEHVAIAVRERVDAARGPMKSFASEARVSAKCVTAIESLFEGAKRMDSWAIKLINSWGEFPMSGIYEGTYGSVGSFETCVDIQKNKHIDHAHYCSVTFRPLMPSQKDYELIVRQEPKELLRLFEDLRFDQDFSSELSHSRNDGRPTASSIAAAAAKNKQHYGNSSSDAFTDILEHAQYHHFVYYKWGTCWPIACSPFDVRRIAKLFGRRSIMLNGPVKCYSKFSDDYEEPDEHNIYSDQNVTDLNRPLVLNITAPQGEGKKLEISVWDRNNGIFIWKPHFNKPHKIALAIILFVTAFLAFMTAIDVCFVRLPMLYRKLVDSLANRPLNYDNRCQNNSKVGAQTNARNHNRTTGSPLGFDANSFSLCGDLVAAQNSYGHLPRHPTRAGFAIVPSGEGLADAINQAGVLTTNGSAIDDDDESLAKPPALFMSVVDDCSVITNISSFFRVSEGQMKNDILCLNGIRCITMIWIIMTHTMMYNDWSAFARTRAIEVALNSLLIQPVFNGSYLVDTFFLMSGLLSAFTAFKHCQGQRQKFNSFAFIFGRWLRLTPQILLVSMGFIVFPALSYGPHWYPIVGEYSENCVKNWWINVLHLQAFYRKEEMCNFVTWWISIDFFFHFFALAVIWIIMLVGHKMGSLTMALIIGVSVIWQSSKHYEWSLPPNVFSTIPQTGAMWTRMTLDFFWTPYTHTIPFFFGFYIGYLMALKQKLIIRFMSTRRALVGWILAVGLLVGQSYSTYWWVVGKASYSRLVSTVFFGACSFIWSASLCWIIIACHHGYGGFVNRVLSWKVFIVLGKSSYLIYLTHFMVLFVFFGNQRTFLEPSTLNMIYIVVGNILLSTLLGIVLCSFYEIPWLKMHRRLMKYV